MTPAQRRRIIEELYEAARDPARRAEVLAAADPALRAKSSLCWPRIYRPKTCRPRICRMREPWISPRGPWAARILLGLRSHPAPK